MAFSASLPWPFAKRGERVKGRKEKHGEGGGEEEQLRLQEFGVTEQLLSFAKEFTEETFKSFPLQDDPESESTAGNVRLDLTEWQEQHAVIVLSKVKEIAKLRYVLCPRHLKEKQFWRIYFLLVKSYVAPYEQHAVQKAKLRKAEMENGKSKKSAIEVEMSESKYGSSSSITLSYDSEPDLDVSGSINEVSGILTSITIST
ncbi:uncharacterized protein [Typha angustifolia]|uniref:uncharacterized protein isoform X1 n=1 Tax=Typha angustifolia TaxID=59011 RepID=UPI003C2FFA43